VSSLLLCHVWWFVVAVGLLCSGTTPPEDQLLGLASELQRSCAAFCSMSHQMTSAAGPTFKEELIKLTQGVVNPCLVLVKEMVRLYD